MSRSMVYLVLALTILGAPCTLSASSPAIGMATATGSFAVNHSQVNGKAALFDGAVVETAGASSRLELSNGARLEVGVNSRVQVFGSEAMLEQGSGEIGSGAGYRMIARTLRIQIWGIS